MFSVVQNVKPKIPKNCSLQISQHVYCGKNEPTLHASILQKKKKVSGALPL